LEQFHSRVEFNDELGHGINYSRTFFHSGSSTCIDLVEKEEHLFGLYLANMFLTLDSGKVKINSNNFKTFAQSNLLKTLKKLWEELKWIKELNEKGTLKNKVFIEEETKRLTLISKFYCELLFPLSPKSHDHDSALYNLLTMIYETNYEFTSIQELAQAAAGIQSHFETNIDNLILRYFDADFEGKDTWPPSWIFALNKWNAYQVFEKAVELKEIKRAYDRGIFWRLSYPFYNYLFSTVFGAYLSQYVPTFKFSGTSIKKVYTGVPSGFEFKISGIKYIVSTKYRLLILIHKLNGEVLTVEKNLVQTCEDIKVIGKVMYFIPNSKFKKIFYIDFKDVDDSTQIKDIKIKILKMPKEPRSATVFAGTTIYSIEQQTPNPELFTADCCGGPPAAFSTVALDLGPKFEAPLKAAVRGNLYTPGNLTLMLAANPKTLFMVVMAKDIDGIPLSIRVNAYTTEPTSKPLLPPTSTYSEDMPTPLPTLSVYSPILKYALPVAVGRRQGLLLDWPANAPACKLLAVVGTTIVQVALVDAGSRLLRAVLPRDFGGQGVELRPLKVDKFAGVVFVAGNKGTFLPRRSSEIVRVTYVRF
jgi:hypothetical protein